MSLSSVAGGSVSGKLSTSFLLSSAATRPSMTSITSCVVKVLLTRQVGFTNAAATTCPFTICRCSLARLSTSILNDLFGSTCTTPFVQSSSCLSNSFASGCMTMSPWIYLWTGRQAWLRSGMSTDARAQIKVEGVLSPRSGPHGAPGFIGCDRHCADKSLRRIGTLVPSSGSTALSYYRMARTNLAQSSVPKIIGVPRQAHTKELT